MPGSRRFDQPPLTRADLPAELTADTLRHLDFRTLGRLAKPGNGVLTAEEQQQFSAALHELRRGTASRIEESLQRAQRAGPQITDPTVRRSFERTQRRLAQQAERALSRYPQAGGTPTAEALDKPASEPATAAPAADDEVSPDILEQEVEQTSETLDLLERIASLQQQQLAHQESKLLSETRGFFFAFLVSISVIVAGVAPLVDAEPHDRLLIVLWTVAATAIAGLAYGIVRAVQSRK